MILERLTGLVPPLARVFRPRRPLVAAEVAEGHLAVVRLGRGGDGEKLAAFHLASLPAGTVRTSPIHQNVLEPAALAPLLEQARDAVSPGGGPLTLCLPDAVARLALIPSDTLPRTEKQLRELVGWRMKKTLPFRLEEARLATQVFSTGDGRHVLLAAAVRERLLAEYEELFDAAGFQVGDVTLSTLALSGQAPQAADGDTLLLNVGDGWFSLFIFSGDEPLFFRCKGLPEGERAPGDRDWFVAGEIGPSLEYYRARLGGAGLKRALVHLTGGGWGELKEALSTVLPVPVEPLRASLGAELPEEARARLAPSLAAAARALPRDARPALEVA